MDYRIGTREHAADVAEGRHPGIQDGLQWLTYAHLPEQLQDFSSPFYVAACEVIRTILTDSPELTTAINGLIAAKDAAMRAGIRHQTGRAGSVPRPQAVVDPPKLTYDDRTLTKVSDALNDCGLSGAEALDAINAMHNRGILFRERATTSFYEQNQAECVCRG